MHESKFIVTIGCALALSATAFGEVVVRPTARQLEWADCELGVIIHHDLQSYDPSYKCHASTNVAPASLFNPISLDTDQWIETAAAAGAKYAVLVAKHCSGFSLWPTKAHDYSVASTPWKNGKGDVVADFMASCKKYGIKPGLYASLGRNAYLGLIQDGKFLPNDQWQRYLEAVKIQLGELWTNYGELFEIWFDGGNLPPERGGLEIEDLMAKLQPNAIVFQGNPRRFSCLRWIGNEYAQAPEGCWSRSNDGTDSTGVVEIRDVRCSGRPDGCFWCPGEADTPNRDNLHAFLDGWFWRAGEDAYVLPAETLMDRYMTSVGRNCNLLIGMAIDNRGLVPDADVAEFRRFGKMVRDLYAHPVARTSGKGVSVVTDRHRLEVDVPVGARPTLLSVKEDLTNGENAWLFALSGFDGKNWHTLVRGGNIGHRRLARFRSGAYVRYRLEFWDYGNRPATVIREFALYE